MKTIARHPRRLTNITSPPPIRPLQFLNTDRRLDKEETAAFTTEVNQGNQTAHHAPRTMPEKRRCPNQDGCPLCESVGLRETATHWNLATATPPTLYDTMPTSGNQMEFYPPSYPHHAPHLIPKKCRGPIHSGCSMCEPIINPNQTTPLLRPLQKQFQINRRATTRTDPRDTKVPQPSPPEGSPLNHPPPQPWSRPNDQDNAHHTKLNDIQRSATTALATATTTLPRTTMLAILMLFKRLLEPSKKPSNTTHSPQPTPGRMEEDADSPSLKALFESMEDMQEEMLEVKATAVCVWPAGAGSYLKGRVNERRDNTGDLVGLMKGALIPGSDHKIDRFEGSIPVKNKQDGSPSFECLFLNFSSKEAADSFCGPALYVPKIKCYEVTVQICQTDGGKKLAQAPMTVHFCLRADIQNSEKILYMGDWHEDR